MFSLGSGANFQAAPGAWVTPPQAVTGATGEFIMTSVLNAQLVLANVQLEAGVQATPFDFKNWGENLADCQRYLQYPSLLFIASGYGAAGGGFWGNFIFPTTMRTTPTVTLSNLTLSNATSFTASYIDPYGFRIAAAAAAAGTCYGTFNAVMNADI
jgi:hypothetical protein